MTAERSTDRRYYGVAEALIVERETEGEGRVKVRFPWFDGSTVSQWCRISQLYAGNGYGSLFVPEEGDEVLVAFIHGDMRQPIVLGGMYNGKDKPTHRPDTKDQKVIRTKAGHQLLLDDTGGERKVVVVDASEKHRIEIDTENDSITIRSQGGKITLEADEIEIKAKDFRANATSVDVTANGAMNLKGGTINLN